MRDKMKIRKYKKLDEKEVKELISQTLFKIFGKHKIPSFEDFSEYKLFLVAENENKIIGTIAINNETNNIARLKRMYIDKNYRNKGLAQRLFNKIKNYCISHNINKIKLTTYNQMREAQKFYIKQGFKITNKRYSDGRKEFISNLK